MFYNLFFFFIILAEVKVELVLCVALNSRQQEICFLDD